jgi:hypothetical protein
MQPKLDRGEHRHTIDLEESRHRPITSRKTINT